uniref:Uncharacterized protein n=1 Tax=Hydrogenophaga sp. PL2G6 TaxID=503997 RepID=B4Y321_9BURK|nr:hypothetical protein [Hydrogenophaga sp. PL2G6]
MTFSVHRKVHPWIKKYWPQLASPLFPEVTASSAYVDRNYASIGPQPRRRARVSSRWTTQGDPTHVGGGTRASQGQERPVPSEAAIRPRRT